MSIQTDLAAALDEYDADPSLGKAVRIIEVARTHAAELAGLVSERDSAREAINTMAESLRGWDDLFRAFIGSGFPPGLSAGEPPLWPNPDWTQDQAMIAYALHRAAIAATAGEATP